MNSEPRQTGSRAINLGLVANAMLALLKTAFGVFGHSQALLADGINSTSDVAYYVVVKVLMHFARRPPDREHPYGHRQLEAIAALAVGAFVITTAIALFWNAIDQVYDILIASASPSPVSHIALWVALLTIVAKIALTVYTTRIASMTGNPAILALARDHRNDIFSACGAAIGIVATRLGYAWADPCMGAVVAIVVLSTGIQILRESSADLMDTVPSEDIERQTHDAISRVPGLRSVEEVLAHRFGPYLVLNVTIGVDGATTVREGDRIASDVENILTSRIELVQRVHVHCHPADPSPSSSA